MSQNFAGFGIDEMHAPAGWAGHRLEAVFVPLRRIACDPALHAQAGIWTAIQKRRHSIPEIADGRHKLSRIRFGADRPR
jgi:hypothetical protein